VSPTEVPSKRSQESDTSKKSKHRKSALTNITNAEDPATIPAMTLPVARQPKQAPAISPTPADDAHAAHNQCLSAERISSEMLHEQPTTPASRRVQFSATDGYVLISPVGNGRSTREFRANTRRFGRNASFFLLPPAPPRFTDDNQAV
jgi:hypothetical protein